MNFGDACLDGATLVGADLQGANLKGAKMPEPLARAGETCLYNGVPYLFFGEEGEQIELRGAGESLVIVPVWYKWTHLFPAERNTVK